MKPSELSFEKASIESIDSPDRVAKQLKAGRMIQSKTPSESVILSGYKIPSHPKTQKNLAKLGKKYITNANSDSKNVISYGELSSENDNNRIVSKELALSSAKKQVFV